MEGKERNGTRKQRKVWKRIDMEWRIWKGIEGQGVERKRWKGRDVY